MQLLVKQTGVLHTHTYTHTLSGGEKAPMVLKVTPLCAGLLLRADAAAACTATAAI